MTQRFIIIILLLGGCGDASTPFAPDTLDAPDPALFAVPDPAVFEAPCNNSMVTDGHWYFYAEAEAPDWDVQVFACTNPQAPFTPPVCEPTTNYVIEDGMIRVLCADWTLGTEVPDFVRIEEVRSFTGSGEIRLAGGAGRVAVCA